MSSSSRTDAENKMILEALLFASEEPLSTRTLARILGRGVDGRTVRRLLEEMRQEYDAQGRAFQIEEIAEGFQMLTRPEYHKWLRELRRSRGEDRLSQSAIETLAIIAYKQPILRAEIEDIRGVQCGPLLRNLTERGLIKIVGRKNVPGRPILYGTTRRFLRHFHLKSLRDLPQLTELPIPAKKPTPPESPTTEHPPAAQTSTNLEEKPNSSQG